MLKTNCWKYRKWLTNDINVVYLNVFAYIKAYRRQNLGKGISMKLPRKKASTPRKPKFADESFTGPEPVWEDWQSWPIEKFHKEKQRAGTYYNYFYQAKDLKPKVIEWMKENGYNKNDIKAIKAAEDWRTNIAVSSVCCSLLRGMPTHHPDYDKYLETLPGVSGGQSNPEDFARKYIDEAIGYGKERLKKKGFEVEKQVKYVGGPTLSIQDRLKISAINLTHEVENFIDEAMQDIEKFDMKKFNALSILRKQQAKPAHAKIIKEYYKPNLDEMTELTGPKLEDNDAYDQLIEAYSNVSPKAQKKWLDIYSQIDQACDMLIESGKQNRKPRKRKPIAKEKLIAKLKFQKEDSTLGLVSANPIEIPGCSELWVYNTKTRKIGKYIATNIDPTGQQREGSGLSIKGTTITGFNGTSIQKTLRKPKDQIDTFKNSGKVLLKKYMDTINAVETKLNGRINEQTILLKINK